MGDGVEDAARRDLFGREAQVLLGRLARLALGDEAVPRGARRCDGEHRQSQEQREAEPGRAEHGAPFYTARIGPVPRPHLR